jgi:hypothetical protein
MARHLLIAGSRSVFPSADFIMQHINDSSLYLDDLEEVVSGGAVGADAAGELWARERGHRVHVIKPDYRRNNPKLAPKLRNDKMAQYLGLHKGVALVFWDGISGGASDMIARCVARQVPVRVVYTNPALYPRES